MSGAALVASDIGGHREYAIHDETALLYPPKNIDKLVSSLLELICNRSKRIKLATQGNIFIKQFTWERAANSFEEILNQDLYKIGNKV
jgi:glycosyltransferase involved in cell wall biosynthesis